VEGPGAKTRAFARAAEYPRKLCALGHIWIHHYAASEFTAHQAPGFFANLCEKTSKVWSIRSRFDAPRCLRETLDALSGDRVAGVATRHEHLAATLACKAAIKAGDELSPGEMRALFIALAATTLPAHDVHGRSTIVQLPWDEIERRFGRR